MIHLNPLSYATGHFILSTTYFVYYSEIAKGNKTKTKFNFENEILKK